MSQKSLFQEVELYDLAEISELCGVSVGTLRRYIKEGRLRAQRFGARYRATREQVQAFLTGKTEPHEAHDRGADWAQPFARHDGDAQDVTDERLQQEQDAAIAEEPPRSTDQPALPEPAGGAALTVSPRHEGTADENPPQLLFMKPEDIDQLVASLAAHTERIEQHARERDRQMVELVAELREENRRLRRDVAEARDETRRGLREATEGVVETVLDPRREEQQRFRFQWLRGRLDELAEQMKDLRPESREPPGRRPRRWFRRSPPPEGAA